MVTNRRLVDGGGADFYPTPAWGTHLLMEHEPFEGDILEPCCGNGAMADVISHYHPGYVKASDLYDRGYGVTGLDVFSYTEAVNFITNPPFNIASDVLEHALRISTGKVCLLLRTAFLESKNRYERFYRDRPPTRVWMFPERLSMYPEGYTVQGGGTTCYSWIVWDQADTNKSTELRWFPTGYKNRKFE